MSITVGCEVLISFSTLLLVSRMTMSLLRLLETSFPCALEWEDVKLN